MVSKISTEDSLKPAAEHFRIDHLNAELSGRTVRGGAIMVTSQGLKFVIMTISTVVLARLLTPEDYGLIGMVVVITGFISIFKNLGLSAAIIQTPEITHEQVSTLFWINVLLSIGITLMTCVLAPAVSWFYGEPKLTMITVVFAVGFIVSGLSAQHEALLRRQMRFVILASVELAAMVASIVTAIVMARRNFGYWALVANQLVLVSLSTIGAWAFCRWRPGLPTRYSGVRPMLAFGRDLTGHNIFNYFTRNLDNLLIGKFWGAQQLAMYSKAYQILLLPVDQLGVPLDGIALTSLSKLRDTAERYRRAFLRIFEKIAMVSMPGIAFMAVTSDWLVRLLLGSQWGRVAPIFTALGLVGLFEPVANTIGWLMISQGRSRHYFHWGIVNSTLTVGSFIIGLPWGGLGVAISFSLIGVLVRIPLGFYLASRAGPVRFADIYGTIVVPLIAAVCIVGSLLLFRHFVQIDHALFGIAAGFFISLTIALVIYLITPQGRSGMIDGKFIVRQLLSRDA